MGVGTSAVELLVRKNSKIMSTGITASAESAAPELPSDRPPGAHAPQASQAKLTLLALGVVYGDIGTSPLYTFNASLAGDHPLPITAINVFGVLSLIFWSLMIVVTLKYVSILMRADNKGEGGSLALLALIVRKAGLKRSRAIVLLGILACALFYGDSMITPAVTVVGAIEGLKTVDSDLTPLVVPISIGILVGLFAIQKFGTGRVGAWFGPIMAVYFVTTAILGALSIIKFPQIILAVSPTYGIGFLANDPWKGFLAIGSVFLCVTGAEALYADMGHFGRKAVTNGWFYLVLPALLLQYGGQAALLMTNPGAISNPFYLLSPDWFRLPLVFIATAAAIIGSGAVISGAFSLSQQAMQLGFIPRLRITHTSASEAGQIFVPIINWALMVAVVVLVIGFGTAENLTAAYGVAVTGAMLIASVQLSIVLFRMWKWPMWVSVPLLILFFTVDISFFSAALMKIPQGGWFPLLVGLALFTLLTTWAKGRKLVIDRLNEVGLPMKVFVKSAVPSATRVPGTAVFMTSSDSGVPPALLHNLKHNKVLHERVFLVTIKIEDLPYVDPEKRSAIADYGQGFYRITLRYGFMEEIDVPAALGKVQECGPTCRPMDTSYFLSRQTLLTAGRPGMAIWREKLFAWMMRNAETAMEFFKLPTNRVVELGSQVEI